MGTTITFFLSKYKIPLLFLGNIEEERTEKWTDTSCLCVLVMHLTPSIYYCQLLVEVKFYSGRVCES